MDEQHEPFSGSPPVFSGRTSFSGKATRMAQYTKWVRGYKDMGPADKRLAERISRKVFVGGFNYRGPWES